MLEQLLQIQAIDLEIEALDAQAARIPRQMAAAAEEVESCEREVEAGRTHLIELEKQRDSLELELDSKTETMHKWETQLFSIRSNKEYQAMLVEIGSIKTDIGLLEDRIIELMDEIDQAGDALHRKRDALEKAKTEYAERTQQLQSELERLQTEIARLRERREPLVLAHDTELYDLYERIRNAKKGGPVVVPLDDTTCSACHMQVPPQTVNEIMADEKVHTCTCSRILYYADNYPSAGPVQKHNETE